MICPSAFPSYIRGVVMKRLLLLLLILGIVVCPADGQRRSRGSGRKDVHVEGYYRKNGTYVHPHDRAAPGMGNHSSSSGSRHSYSRTGSSSYSHPHLSSGSSRRDSHGHVKRSKAARDSFQRGHPCPSTGKRSGRCPGYVVDHVNPLECGGVDAPSNMQWQTVAAGKAKDKTEGNCRK
jgi:hypothetical protein